MRCTSSASPTRSPTRSTAAAPTTSSSAATSATSRSPASPPTSTSASRRRACSRCASRCTGTSAHGSTPWLGDNAVLKAVDVFRQIESMPFARESSELFDRPSIILGRVIGGDAFEQGARPLRHRRRHPLPARPGPDADPRRHRGDPRHQVATSSSAASPRSWTRDNPYVQTLAEAAADAEHAGRVDLGRPRRRLRHRQLPRRGRAGRGVRARSAAATTAPRSGSRSPRSSATARRSSTSSTRSRRLGAARTCALPEHDRARGDLEALPDRGADRDRRRGGVGHHGRRVQRGRPDRRRSSSGDASTSGDELAEAAAGQAADDPADRLRQARQDRARRRGSARRRARTR